MALRKLQIISWQILFMQRCWTSDIIYWLEVQEYLSLYIKNHDFPQLELSPEITYKRAVTKIFWRRIQRSTFSCASNFFIICHKFKTILFLLKKTVNSQHQNPDHDQVVWRDFNLHLQLLTRGGIAIVTVKSNSLVS